ncbi:hypothetical protein EVAR_31097_1 [Eumeta japonica]|uniref:Uncharacterized protein n=1 Tax=Eumeta variegata TaxID=151549 RepID=A0A4C1VFV5_EUMVA|nr:hypothetical protein EVAR_31097_1 [Eumeta japonica]
MDTRNPRRVTNALEVGKEGMGYRNSHLLDKRKQWKLLIHVERSGSVQTDFVLYPVHKRLLVCGYRILIAFKLKTENDSANSAATGVTDQSYLGRHYSPRPAGEETRKSALKKCSLLSNCRDAEKARRCPWPATVRAARAARRGRARGPRSARPRAASTPFLRRLLALQRGEEDERLRLVPRPRPHAGGGPAAPPPAGPPGARPRNVSFANGTAPEAGELVLSPAQLCGRSAARPSRRAIDSRVRLELSEHSTFDCTRTAILTRKRPFALSISMADVTARSDTTRRYDD